MKLDKDETQKEQHKGESHRFMIFYGYFRIIEPGENILVEIGFFES